MKVPSQTQTYEGKPASDYISEDANIEWDETTGHVTGTIRYNTESSGATVISAPAISGNFFPITLDSSCAGKEVTVKRTSATAATKVERQTSWLLSLPDGTATTYTITCEDRVIANLDFVGATLLPDASKIISAIDQSHNLGSLVKNVSDLQSADTAVAPNGNVTGTLKYIPYWKEFSSNTAQQKGHYIALRLSEEYKAKPMTVTGKSTETATDEDWVLIVEDNNSTFKFETEGKELFTLNFKNTVFEERKTGENAVSAPHGEENLGIVERASDIVEDNYRIEWTGNAGTLNGHVKWHEFADEHFVTKKTGRYVPLTVSGYDGYELSVTNLDATEYEINGNNIVIRIDEVGARYVGISCNGDEIASITFGGLTMEKPMGSQVLTIAAQEDTIDSKLVSDYCDDDIAIAWGSGDIGEVTGTFKKKDETLQKWLLPVKLNAYFKTDGVTIYGVSSYTEDMKAFIPVANNKSTIMIKSGTRVVATLKFTNATLTGGDA